MASTPDIPCEFTTQAMIAQYMALRTALATETHDRNDGEAFSKEACVMPPFEWARAYLYPWPAIQWVAMRLTEPTCSASGCEHAGSIEGWIHSKKRNRLGQQNVERLVRAHTNLHLEARLNDWKASALPCEIDMTAVEDEVDESDAVVRCSYRRGPVM